MEDERHFANHPKSPLEQLISYFERRGFTVDASTHEAELFLHYLLNYPRIQELVKEIPKNSQVDEPLKHHTHPR